MCLGIYPRRRSTPSFLAVLRRRRRLRTSSGAGAATATAEMIVFEVVFQGGVLDKGHAADGTEVRSLPAVLAVVDPQRLGQGEPLPAVRALVGPFPRVGAAMLLQGAVGGIRLRAGAAAEVLHSLVGPVRIEIAEYNFSDQARKKMTRSRFERVVVIVVIFCPIFFSVSQNSA